MCIGHVLARLRSKNMSQLTTFYLASHYVGHRRCRRSLREGLRTGAVGKIALVCESGHGIQDKGREGKSWGMSLPAVFISKWIR